MNCVNSDICVYHLCVFFFPLGAFLSSTVTGACPVTTDLIMRVYVRTTTTTTYLGFILRFIRQGGSPSRGLHVENQ